MELICFFPPFAGQHKIDCATGKSREYETKTAGRPTRFWKDIHRPHADNQFRLPNSVRICTASQKLDLPNPIQTTSCKDPQGGDCVNLANSGNYNSSLAKVNVAHFHMANTNINTGLESLAINCVKYELLKATANK